MNPKQYYDMTNTIHVTKIRENAKAVLYEADNGRFWALKTDPVKFDGDKLTAPIWWLNKREFV